MCVLYTYVAVLQYIHKYFRTYSMSAPLYFLNWQNNLNVKADEKKSIQEEKSSLSPEAFQNRILPNLRLRNSVPSGLALPRQTQKGEIQEQTTG